jgi:hypothetical protein
MTVPLAPGDLLIASPGLGDPNFRRAVIVLCDHGPEGSLGLILNRPMEVPLGSVLPALSGGPAGEERVLQGGPVENGRLLGLRRGAAPEEAVEEVGRDLHLLVDLEGSLRRLEAGDGDPSDYASSSATPAGARSSSRGRSSRERGSWPGVERARSSPSSPTPAGCGGTRCVGWAGAPPGSRRCRSIRG